MNDPQFNTIALWLIASLLTALMCLCLMMYRGVMARLEAMEIQHKNLCTVTLIVTIALHPEQAEKITAMMKSLFDGKLEAPKWPTG